MSKDKKARILELLSVCANLLEDAAKLSRFDGKRVFALIVICRALLRRFEESKE